MGFMGERVVRAGRVINGNHGEVSKRSSVSIDRPVLEKL